MTRQIFYLLVLSFAGLTPASGQGLSNLRKNTIAVTGDTVQIDSMSIAPGTADIFVRENIRLDTALYTLDWVHGRIIFKRGISRPDSITVRYRTFSFLFDKPVQHKDPGRLTAPGTSPNPFTYQPSTERSLTLFPQKGLAANGSISRGVTFGNNQDVFVNSALNLQLTGKISDDVEILAAITDENIPIQPEGNTQQLQEFDRVFIQLSHQQSRLIAGDFELRRPDSYFMNLFKRGQGVMAVTSFPLGDSAATGKAKRMNTGASLAIAKGRFARNVFAGIEGNQGPYRLIGNEGESFIIVLSGTEKVFIDGQLMLRGMQNDYVIDYNTAEITFTPRRLITKDIRIIVEFEYSDKNYVRSLYYFNNEFVTDRYKLKLNVYSEQDSKNQPLLQELDSAQKAVMADIGDSLQFSYYPTADSLSQFDDTRVLYIRKDTVTSSGTFSDIFVYSTDPQEARWLVTFSDVGAGKGDYVQDISSANGRVFKWIEPLNGVSQGNYMPVRLLITPKQRRMITLGGDVRLGHRKNLSIETAWSDNDINLFSDKNKSNDQGLGTRLHFDNYTFLSMDTLRGWKLGTFLDYEFASQNFRPLEPYRPAEFVRDWNISGLNINDDEHIGAARLSLSRNDIGTAGYQLKTYLRGSAYSGWNHSVGANLGWNKFTLKGSGSYLITGGDLSNTRFLRHQFEFARTAGKWVIGIRDNAERNRYFAPQSDSLLANSYTWQEWQGFVAYKDSSRNQGTLAYKYRTDYGTSAGQLQLATVANEVMAAAELAKNPKNQLRLTSTYRDLDVIDSALTPASSLQTLVNRIDHTLSILKGAMTAVTYYEIGSGQERRQEYYYLEVPAGQGTHAYIGDLNSNGVQDLNEFALANFPDQARYISVFLNTNNYITTRTNNFSEVLNFIPAAAAKQQGRQSFLNRWSDQFLLRLEKKTTGEELLSSLNPFSRDLGDSVLVSTNSNVRNTVFYNRNDPKYGADFTWQESQNKSFLTTGYEYRQTTSQVLSFRWNITRQFLINLGLEKENNINSSEFFSDRNYRLNINYAEPRLTWQPGSSFRTTLSFRTGSKKNTLGTNGEELYEDRLSAEIRYNNVNSGTLSARVNYINLDYNASENSYLSYVLLGGLRSGTNYTWNLSLLKNLNNVMQLNINYEGRKSEDTKAVHTGGVQFRAFF